MQQINFLLDLRARGLQTGRICGINGYAVARHGLILSEDGATAYRKPLGALLDPSDIIFA